MKLIKTMNGYFVLVLICLGFIFSYCNITRNSNESNENFQEQDTLDITIEDTIRWTADNSPYILEDTVVVDSTTLLDIEPGVTVKSEQGVGIINKGLVKALGTKQDSIKFTSVNGEKWVGFDFINCSKNTILKYCKIDRGVGASKFITIINSSPTFSNCVIKDFLPMVETGGLLIYCGDSSHPIIKNSIFHLNVYKGVALGCENSNPKIKNNDIILEEKGSGAVYRGGFLEGNYLAIDKSESNEKGSYVPDISLGEPIDREGDGVCNTTSTDSLKLFKNVDGRRNPAHNPNFLKND